MVRFALILAATFFFAAPAHAQDEKWQVGQHPDYHVAMVKQVDQVLVAIYVTKRPSIYASPLVIETVLAPCGSKKPISMHGTEAILAFGATAEERLLEVRRTLDSFFDRGKATCKLADDLEERFFNRFEDAYAATDAILVEAGIFPLSAPPTATGVRDAKGKEEAR